MKKNLLFVLTLFLGLSLFANDWNVVENNYEDFIYYKIKDAPEKYQSLIDSTVYTWQTKTMYRNLYPSSCKDQVIEYLKNEKFEVRKIEDKDYPFFAIEFLEKNFPELFNVNIPLLIFHTPSFSAFL